MSNNDKPHTREVQDFDVDHKSLGQSTLWEDLAESIHPLSIITMPCKELSESEGVEATMMLLKEITNSTSRKMSPKLNKKPYPKVEGKSTENCQEIQMAKTIM